MGIAIQWNLMGNRKTHNVANRVLGWRNSGVWKNGHQEMGPRKRGKRSFLSLFPHWNDEREGKVGLWYMRVFDWGALWWSHGWKLKRTRSLKRTWIWWVLSQEDVRGYPRQPPLAYSLTLFSFTGDWRKWGRRTSSFWRWRRFWFCFPQVKSLRGGGKNGVVFAFCVWATRPCCLAWHVNRVLRMGLGEIIRKIF